MVGSPSTFAGQRPRREPRRWRVVAVALLVVAAATGVHLEVQVAPAASLVSNVGPPPSEPCSYPLPLYPVNHAFCLRTSPWGTLSLDVASALPDDPFTMTVARSGPTCGSSTDRDCIVGVEWTGFDRGGYRLVTESGTWFAFKGLADCGFTDFCDWYHSAFPRAGSFYYQPFGFQLTSICTRDSESCSFRIRSNTLPIPSAWVVAYVQIRVREASGSERLEQVEAVFRLGPPQTDNLPPTADLTFAGDPSDPGLFHFTDLSTDPDGDALSASWDFGDGGTGSGHLVDHAFTSPGTYDVTLTVTDPNGESDAITRSVVVDELLDVRVEKVTLQEGTVHADLVAQNFSDGTIDLTFDPADLSGVVRSGADWVAGGPALLSGPTPGFPATLAADVTTTHHVTFELPEPATDAGISFRLRATRGSVADVDETVTPIPAAAQLQAVLDLPDAPVEMGTPFPAQVTIRNNGTAELAELTLADGVGLKAPEWVTLHSGPTWAAPATLAPGEAVVVGYELVTTEPGTSIVDVEVTARTPGDVTLTGTDTGGVDAQSPLRVGVDTSVGGETKIGDTFDVVVTVVNEHDSTIGGIHPDHLNRTPDLLASLVSGPVDADGNDARSQRYEIEPGKSVSFLYVLRAERRGVLTMAAGVSATAPRSGLPFLSEGSSTVGIGAPALAVEDLSITPGSPSPADIVSVRGTLHNTGDRDITGIDFELTSTPDTGVSERMLERLKPEASPRMAELEAGETHDFAFPIYLTAEPGGRGRLDITLTFTGTSLVDGNPVDVHGTGTTINAIDLTEYWTNLVEDMQRLFRDGFWELVEGINTWGDESTLGGIVVGGTEGVVNLLTKVGDAELAIKDTVEFQSKRGGIWFKPEAEAAIKAIVDWDQNTPVKEKQRQVAALFGSAPDAVVSATVGSMADWAWELTKAYEAGDTRTVSRMLAEPAAETALGFGVDAVTAKVVGGLLAKVPAPVREGVENLAKRFKRTPRDNGANVNPADLDDVDDLKDLPPGHRVSGVGAGRFGLTEFEVAYMTDIAKKHGVCFFVRPRTAEAQKWARLLYNAKPEAIKLKSIIDIDVDFLGFDDLADRKGLLVLRQPERPDQKIMEAILDGKLKPDVNEADAAYIKAINERYQLRKAEFEARAEVLKYQEQEFTILKHGEPVKTRLTVDDDGIVRFTHDGKPVYTDIDLLHIAKADGSPILEPDEYHRLMNDAKKVLDLQHGDTGSAADFTSPELAEKFFTRYTDEHKLVRADGSRGDPVLAIGPTRTATAYVESATFGSNPGGALNALNSVTYYGTEIKP